MAHWLACPQSKLMQSKAHFRDELMGEEDEEDEEEEWDGD
jgi:hypothetical protein